MDTLPKNTAEWDRSLRFGVALALFFGLPAWIHNAYALMAGGILAGMLLVAALTGF